MSLEIFLVIRINLLYIFFPWPLAAASQLSAGRHCSWATWNAQTHRDAGETSEKWWK